MKEVHTVAKMGRPRAESPKKKNVSFRLTEKEYQKLSEYAAKHELTTTQAIQKGIDLLYQMELYELKNLCMEMASLGAANYVKQTTPAKDLISQREAYRLFQECRVKRWQKDGMVSTIRGGSSIHSKVLYSRAELLAVDKSEKINSIINK